MILMGKIRIGDVDMHYTSVATILSSVTSCVSPVALVNFLIHLNRPDNFSPRHSLNQISQE